MFPLFSSVIFISNLNVFRISLSKPWFLYTVLSVGDYLNDSWKLECGGSQNVSQVKSRRPRSIEDIIWMKARATCKRHFPQKIDSQLQLSAASHVYVLFCSFSSPFVVFYHFPLMLGLFTDQELLMQVQEKWETVDTTNCIHELSFLFLLDASTVPYDGFW